ncbi:MAG: phage tail tape measure protein, partial [Desulfuromonadaceae bacterium]|nr:phage tail tape measure protein [Desulfuromonadaceae bacterium]
ETVNKAVYAAISAGVDYKDALGALSQAEKLSVAGKANLDSTLVALVSTLNAYGASTDEAAGYAATFFNTVKYGQTTIPELASSLAQVTGIAATAGVPFDELAAAIAALTATGMPTSQAITSIKAALANIIKPTSDAKKIAEELGLEFNAQALASKGLAGMLADVRQATGGNVETMGRLFGSVEGLNGVMVLSNDSAGKFALSLEAMGNKAGVTETAFSKMSQNADLAMQRLVNNMKATLIDLGTPLLDDYGEAVSGLEQVFRSLGLAVQDGALADLQGLLEDALRQTGNYLQGIAKVLPEALAGVDWSGVVDSVRGLGGEIGDLFRAMFGGIDLTTADGLRDFVQKLADGLEALTRITKGTLAGMEPLVALIGEAIEKISSMDDDTLELAGNLLGLGKTINTLAGFVEGITDAIGSLGDGMKLLATGQIAGLIAKLSGAGSFAAALGTAQTAATGLLGVLAGPAGLLATIAASGTAVTLAVREYNAWQAAEDDLTQSLIRGDKARLELEQRYAAISAATGVAIDSTEHFHRLIRDGELVFDQASRTWLNAGQAQDQLAESSQTAALSAEHQARTWDQVRGNLAAMGIELDETGNRINRAADGMQNNADAAQAAASAYYQLQGNSKEVADIMARLDAESGAAADSLKKVEKETEAVRLKMLELASNEKIRTMELTVDIRIAEIEAQTKQVEAAFESVNSVVSDTSDAIASMVGSIAGLDFTPRGDSSKVNYIKGVIEKQMQMQAQSLEKQNEMLDEQIRLMRIRNNQMAEGGGLIKIDSTGLEPALEMVMWQILEKVQLRVSEEAGQFLIGM